LKDFVLKIILVAIAFSACSVSAEKTYNEITVEEVRMMIDAKDESVFLLDVRTLVEYHGELGHLPTAILIPHNELEGRLAELSGYKDKKIITYCRSGVRSVIASKILSKNGYDVYNMTGGMNLWKSTYPDYNVLGVK